MPTLEEISQKIRSAGATLPVITPKNQQLPGGEADNNSTTDFDPEELKKGIAVEMEHTDDAKIAEEIAMDHLREDKDYYKKLEVMEKENVDKSIYSKFAAR